MRTVKMCEAGAVRLKELIPVAWHVYCEAASLDASQLSDEAFIEKLRTRVVLAERHILATLNFPIFDARRDFAVPMVWKMAEFYRLEQTATDATSTPTPAGLGIAKTAVNILLDLYEIIVNQEKFTRHHRNRLYTPLPIIKRPDVLAAGALWLARDMLCPEGAIDPLYMGLLWYEHAGVTADDLRGAGIWHALDATTVLNTHRCGALFLWAVRSAAQRWAAQSA